MSSPTKDSQQPQITKSGRGPDGRFLSGERPQRRVPLPVLLERLKHCKLLLHTETLRRTPDRKMDATCPYCHVRKTYWVDNLLSGHGCRCQMHQKYFDPRAETLGDRYDAMIQRCNTDTHVSSHNYKGRGIKVLFHSREHFIRWALATYPDSSFKGLDFDRINNDGHYSPDNLRLVTRKVNLANRRKSTTS